MKRFQLGKWTLVAMLCAVPILLTACRGNKNEQGFVELDLTKTTFSFDQESAGDYDIFKEYLVATGDVLDVLYHVNTWNSDMDEFKLAVDHEVSVKFVNTPDLNETQLVRPDGKISLPYLGSVLVVGKTVDELATELKNSYKDILRDPEIYVLVPEFRSAIKEFKKDLHTAPRGLSRRVMVRPDGYATFAMLGDFKVKGLTIPQISEKINAEYNNVLFGLSVDLFLEEHSGAQVYILGEVNEPGSYNISRYTSIIEALSLSGGTTNKAKLNSVVVVRRQGDKMVATKVNVKKTLSLSANGRDKSDNKVPMMFFLKPDDIVYIPKRRIAKMADIAEDIKAVTFLRGWDVSFSHDLSY